MDEQKNAPDREQGKEQAIEGLADAIARREAPPAEGISLPVVDQEDAVRRRYAPLLHGERLRALRPLTFCAAILVALVLAAAAALRGGDAGEGGLLPGLLPAAEHTARVEIGTMERRIQGEGQAAPRTELSLGGGLRGNITAVYVQAGQTVKAGDKLFAVDPAEMRAQLETAQTALAAAQAALDAADAEGNAARQSVAELTTTAPFAGLVERTTGRIGETAAAGTAVLTLADDAEMKLPLYFSSGDGVQAGAAATVTVAGQTVTGQVESAVLDGNGRVRVVISMKNPGGLKKGQTASAEVAVAGGVAAPLEAGLLEYGREQEITVRQSGEITSLIQKERAAAGAVLVQQRNDALTAAVEQAAAALEERQKDAVEKQQQVTALETLLAGAAVTSPISGTVTEMRAAVGQQLTGDSAPCTVADTGTLVIHAKIRAEDVGVILPGQAARATLADRPETVLTGKVDSVFMRGEGDSAAYTAVIALDTLPEGVTLALGDSARCEITAETLEDCLTIPARAIVQTADGAAVFAKAAKGHSLRGAKDVPLGVSGVPQGYRMVPVSVGITDGERIEILDGLEEGDTVYLDGPQDLRPEKENGSSSSTPE